jgi:small subunit ribosomal protein S1
MSDEFDQNNNEENFADLLAEFEDSRNEDIQIGDKIKGPIIAIGKDTVFIDTGTKFDGLVEKTELMDEEGTLPVKVGDELELFVVAFSGNEIRLSNAMSGIGGLRHLEEAFHNRVPIEGTVKDKIKGGFQVEVFKRRAFCPISQIDIQYVEDTEPYLGATFHFLITRLEEEGRNIVLSRRILLEEERDKAVKGFLQTLEAGQIIEGEVTKLMPYGAFISLFPGVEGMVHISELKWSRVDNPSNVLTVGDRIKTRILSIEKGDRSNKLKIALSLKQATEDPWNHILEHFKVGEKIEGKVRQATRFGVFVEIADGLEGLVHISEMSYTKRVVKPENEVEIGETVEVMIKDIDTDNRKISLSIKDAEGDPWITVPDRYRPGQTLKGTVDKQERFGYFIHLEPGITGLLPMSRLKEQLGDVKAGKLKPGDEITVTIDSLDPVERKISLLPGQTAGMEDWKQFVKPKQDSLGSLGEKLKKALKEKE